MLLSKNEFFLFILAKSPHTLRNLRMSYISTSEELAYIRFSSFILVLPSEDFYGGFCSYIIQKKSPFSWLLIAFSDFWTQSKCLFVDLPESSVLTCLSPPYCYDFLLCKSHGNTLALTLFTCISLPKMFEKCRVKFWVKLFYNVTL